MVAKFLSNVNETKRFSNLKDHFDEEDIVRLSIVLKKRGGDHIILTYMPTTGKSFLTARIENESYSE